MGLEHRKTQLHPNNILRQILTWFLQSYLVCVCVWGVSLLIPPSSTLSSRSPPPLLVISLPVFPFPFPSLSLLRLKSLLGPPKPSPTVFIHLSPSPSPPSCFPSSWFSYSSLLPSFPISPSSLNPKVLASLTLFLMLSLNR